VSILLILLAGTIIRLFGLNQSLWLDEATTANVSRFSLDQIINSFSIHDFHPPGFYIFLKFWTDVFGNSPVSIRAPSIIFSLISAYFIFLIGRNLKNRTTGLWSAAFFLFNPLIVYYSQEARMYMMSTCLLTIAAYALIKLQSLASLNKIYYLVLFNLCVGLSFLTFYGTVFLIATFYLYLLFKRQFKLIFLLYLVF